jgi:hypothetical protein
MRPVAALRRAKRIVVRDAPADPTTRISPVPSSAETTAAEDVVSYSCRAEYQTSMKSATAMRETITKEPLLLSALPTTITSPDPSLVIAIATAVRLFDATPTPRAQTLSPALFIVATNRSVLFAPLQLWEVPTISKSAVPSVALTAPTATPSSRPWITDAQMGCPDPL